MKNFTEFGLSVI